MNTNTTTNELTPATLTSNRPRIKTSVRPPDSRVGPLTPDERRQVMAQSPVRGLYDQTQDRESAFERLKARAEQKTAAAQAPPAAPPVARRGPADRPSQGEQMIDAFARSAMRSLGSQVGRQLIRGVLGGLLGSSRR